MILCYFAGKFQKYISVMVITKQAISIFRRAIDDYHVLDDVNQLRLQPYGGEGLAAMLYEKAWIDTVQWHLEDLIRDPHIDPVVGMELKHRIDRSNQNRTDLVEQIDSYFRNKYKDVKVSADATLNTESPAWAVDRLCILCLKIYHMKEQTLRTDVDEAHKQRCQAKLDVLLEQLEDLSSAIDQLLNDISEGRKYMKVYRQMKMYNDPATNPVLYGQGAAGTR